MPAVSKLPKKDACRKAHQWFPRCQPVSKIGMSRGILVVDENLLDLVPLLADRNFKVVEPPRGMDDEDILRCIVGHRALVTDNPRDFADEITSREFSIIDASLAAKEPAALAKTIHRAWVSLDLGACQKAHKWFLLRLRPDGRHVLTFPEN